MSEFIEKLRILLSELSDKNPSLLPENHQRSRLSIPTTSVLDAGIVVVYPFVSLRGQN